MTHPALRYAEAMLARDAGRVIVTLVAPDGRSSCLSFAPEPDANGRRSLTFTGDLPTPEARAALVTALSVQHLGIAKLLADVPGNVARIEAAP